MKKIFCILIISFITITVFPQSTPLSTILNYFNTGDTPTEAQFAISWRNSYNAVADGMWDLTGYPSITFAPFTTMQVGKFSQVAGFPTDTTIALNFNGTLKVSNLWVGNQKWNGGGGSGGWTLDAGKLYPTSALTSVAIGTTVTNGNNLYVLGSTYSTTKLGTNTLDLFSATGDHGYINIDAFGNMQFGDEINATPVSLSTLLGSGSWVLNSNVISSILPNTNKVSIGQDPGIADSLFNVYGTMYVEGLSHFRMEVEADSGLITNDYIETPRVNFVSGLNSGRIDLFTAGKLTFYDADYPSGISLLNMSKGYFGKTGNIISPLLTTDNLAIGGSGFSIYDLTVHGQSMFVGTANYAAGIYLGYAAPLSFQRASIRETPIGEMLFDDPLAGSVTLSQLIGATLDSFSVSRINVDTVFLNDSYTQKIFSPHTKDIYYTIDNAQWRMQKFSTESPLSVFHSDAFQFESLLHDSLQTKTGWYQKGKMYISQTDTTPTYYTGKPLEWRKLATQDWVTEVVTGGLGTSPTFDTVYLATTEYLTSTGQTFKLGSTGTGGTLFTIETDATPRISNSNGDYITYNTGNLTFGVGANSYIFDGLLWKNVTDTLATLDDARTLGGGGSPFSLTTSADASPDTILTYLNGGFGRYVTPLFSSATSFITGYASTADSVALGKSVRTNNDYNAETSPKYSYRSLFDYNGGNMNTYSKNHIGYSDANANNGLSYGIYSHLYSNNNYASTGNTSYSNAGRFIIENRGSTTIGGASPGSLYYTGVYGEVAGTINKSATPGAYVVSGLYGKSSNVGSAVSYAGYFDGNVNVNGTTYLDTIYIDPLNYIVSSGTFSLTFKSKFVGAVPIDVTLSNGGAGFNFLGINSAIFAKMDYLTFRNNNKSYFYNGDYWYNATDTLADREYARSFGGGGGTGIIDTTGLPVSNQIAYFTAANKIGGNAGFKFTGATKTAASFYTGTISPTNTNRLNFDGALHLTNLYNYGYMYYSKYSSLTDTFAVVMYPGGRIDTASIVAVSGSSGGTGTIGGSISANQIAFGISSNSIGGNAGFIFTGSTKTAGAFYLGTTLPNQSNRLNFDGDFYASTIYSSGHLRSNVLNTNSGIRAAGYFYTGTTAPVSTNRLNYDGNLYSTNLTVTNNILSAVINTNSSTRLAAYWYTGTTAPVSTNRLNYDGELYATSLYATNNIRSNVLNTNGVSRISGYWYTGTTNPISTNRLNYDGDLYVNKLVSVDSIGAMYFGSSTYTRYAGISRTGYFYPDSTHTASFALDMKLPSIEERLQRGYNGEINWYTQDAIGEVVPTNEFSSLTLGNQMGALMAASELNLRHIAELEKRINQLEKKRRNNR